MTTDALLIIAAIVCFLLSAFGVASRVNLQSLGLALLSITFLT